MWESFRCHTYDSVWISLGYHRCFDLWGQEITNVYCTRNTDLDEKQHRSQQINIAGMGHSKIPH